MQAWCLLVLFLCGTGILVGTYFLSRARGVRVVSGQKRAPLEYAWLAGGVVLAALTAGVDLRVYLALTNSPDISRQILPILLATPLLLLVGLCCMWGRARSLGRGVIFYNVRRDDLVAALTDTFRQMQLPATNRLRTFRDEFTLPQGRIVVHGAIKSSCIEFIGPDEVMQARLVDSIVAHLRSTLEPGGRAVIDERQHRIATA